MNNPKLIPIDQIVANPYQPRESEDPAVVTEIAESIKHNGLMQVPTARQLNGHYELAFGHTRLAAFKLLKESTMPLIVRELSDLQMFELGVAENIKRRDLNPIEQARAMHRYMKDFGKNSVQTGEFFGVSAEKVRSTIRLLNLPENLQGGVADGSITQTDARRLLTIQRVAPNDVEKVAQKLKSDTDPDRVISEALTNTGKSIEMWQRWQRGEPQAGNNLWPLRMTAESFPQKELPELHSADVIRSLDLKSTPELKKKIDTYLVWLRESPEKVSAYVEEHADDALLIERIAHLLNPPACTACPLYAKVDGSHYCTFRTCHTRKSHAWEKHKIKTASKKLGIKIWDPKVDGKDNAHLSTWVERDKKLVANRNPDLRLKKGTNWSGRFEGVPEGYSIMVIGETLKKLRKTTSNEQQSRSNDHETYIAEQRRLSAIREANRTALYDFLWNVATPAFQPVISGVTSLDFVQQFADRVVRGVPAEEPDKKAKKDVKLDFYRRAILFSILDDDDLWDISQKSKPVTAVAKHLQGVATTWGIKLPKNWMALASEADKGIKVPAEEGKPA